MAKSKRNITAATLEKYKLIIDEWFVNSFNGRQAYKKYYPNSKDETATTNFSKIQLIPEVKEYIDFKYEEASKYVEMTTKGILNELKNWIESDITDTIGLSPEEIKLLPKSFRRLINKYKETENSYWDKDGNELSKTKTIELSFVSKERAMDMINKHLGFYRADNEQKKASINLDLIDTDTLMKLYDARSDK